MTVSRTRASALRWLADGTTTFVDTAAALPSHDWTLPSGLPDWTRSHLVAHVAANADALRNLAHWAATSEPTPMYASPEARAEGIAKGSQLTPEELLAWLRQSADQLDVAIEKIDEANWRHEVVTGQGRTVPASEIPWLRAREVWVHAVDLASGRSFADFPEDLLLALREDIVAKRGDVPAVEGDLPEVVAYLAGRPARHVRSPGGGPVPALGPWL
jgi:maleylpyruvate isomerase